MKPGRNDLCSCGSGLKFKRCCLLTKNAKSSLDLIKSVNPNEAIEDDFDFDFDEDEDDDFEDDFFDFDDDELDRMNDFLISGLMRFRQWTMDKKPHIKAYKKIRKLHQEVVNSMMDYYHDGKFEPKIDPDYVSEEVRSDTLYLFNAEFSSETREGAQAFADMLIYKPAPNMTCITEEYINKKRYRKPEKVDFLHAMLNSKISLFESTKAENDTGYVYLKDVFSGEIIKIIDIGYSGNPNHSDYYIYTRLITYNDISFNTGLNLIFKKNDPFIKSHIKEHKKKYNKNTEFYRFVQLYNRFKDNPDKVRVASPVNRR